jgi:hypothetical protein
MMTERILPSVNSRPVRVFAACLMLASLAALCVLATGCQPTVKSPISNKDVTADQLVREADAKAAKIQEEADARAETARKRLAEAKAEARARLREVAGDVESTVLSAKQTTASIEDDLGEKVTEATFDYEQGLSLLKQRQETLEAQVNGGLEEIERKRQTALGVLSFVKNIPVVGQGLNAAGLGDITPIATLLLGGGVAAWSNRRSQRKQDEAWDESERKARTAAEDLRRAEAVSWDQAKAESMANTQAQLLALMTQIQAAQSTK